VALDEKTEHEFRKKAIEKFGMKRGYLKAALTEAVLKWLKEN